MDAARELKDLRGVGRRVDHAFRAVLGRDPSPVEADLWVALVDEDARHGLEDLVWTLVNSHEFLFLR